MRRSSSAPTWSRRRNMNVSLTYRAQPIVGQGRKAVFSMNYGGLISLSHSAPGIPLPPLSSVRTLSRQRLNVFLGRTQVPYLIAIIYPKNDFVTKISATVHRKYYVQFCLENAKCVIFWRVILKESLRTFLQNMLTKGRVIFTYCMAVNC